MTRRQIKIEPAGTDALRVRLLGDRTRPEPSTFLVEVPGGEIEVSRTSDDRYWVHVRPWTEDNVLLSEGTREAGRLDTARVDYAEPGGRITDGEEIGFKPGAAHVAVLLGRRP